jgi:hypothetical protein
MNLKQYLSEEKLIDNVARIVPWFAPLIPASFAYHNSVSVLRLIWYEAAVVAFVVELLGLATVHTFFSLAESMKTAKENKPKHETIIMGFMATFYLAIVVTVNILLDLEHTWQIIAARALLSLISIPAAVTLSIRNLHKLRQNDDTRDHIIASLRGKLGNMTKQLDKAIEERDTAVSRLDSIKKNLDTINNERDIAVKQLTKQQKMIDSGMIQLDKLPPRLADYVTMVANGVTPNGAFTDKYGIGESSLTRANSILLGGENK